MLWNSVVHHAAHGGLTFVHSARYLSRLFLKMFLPQEKFNRISLSFSLPFSRCLFFL